MEGNMGESTLPPWACAKTLLLQAQGGKVKIPPQKLASTVDLLHHCATSAYVSKASQRQLAEFVMVYHEICRLGKCVPNPLDIFVENVQRSSNYDCDVVSLARVVGAFCEDSCGTRYERIRETLFTDFVFLAHFVIQQSFESNDATGMPLFEKFQELLLSQCFQQHCSQLGHCVLNACAERLSCQRRSASPQLFSDAIELNLRLLSKAATPIQLISVFTEHLAHAVDAAVRQKATIFIGNNLRIGLRGRRTSTSGPITGLDGASTQHFMQSLMQLAVHDPTQKVRLAAYTVLTKSRGRRATATCWLQLETSQKLLLSALLLRDKAKQMRKKALDVLTATAHQVYTMSSTEIQADVLYWILVNVVWFSDCDRDTASVQREIELGVRIVLEQLTGCRMTKQGQFPPDSQEQVQQACFASCARLTGSKPELGPLLQHFFTEKQIQDIVTQAFMLAR